MADAWGLLIDNSTLTPPGFDAWEHLNNQTAGDPGTPYAVLVTDFEIEVSMSCYELDIEQADLTMEIDTDDFDMEIEDNEYTLEICDE